MTKNKRSNELVEILSEELKTIYRLIGVMKPKNEAEFIAVALPNLHIRVYKLLDKIYYDNIRTNTPNKK